MMAAGGDASEPTASLTHDLGGQRTLHSYRPEPAAQTREADRISERLYGCKTQSPRTPYLCLWRDTGPPGAGTGGQRPPSDIFLTCVFGSSPWTPPAALFQEAEERMRRDEAVLRATWERRSGGWEMTRFEIEIRDTGSGLAFRSVNFGDEVADLEISEADFTFPNIAADPLDFRMSASAPQRQNRGSGTGRDRVSLTMSGTAVPMPDWVMY